MKVGLGVVVLITAGVAGVFTQPGAPARSVDEILDGAIARTQWIENQGIRARYRFRLVSESRKLKSDGSVDETELEVYEVAPIRGVPYARLVSKNGAPLDDEEFWKERQRLRKFLERLDSGKDPSDDDEPPVGFDEDLASRYDFTDAGVETLDGRRYHVLAFEPKPGKLPTRRRIDVALNRSRGRIWIDEATYEIGRVQFELIDKVRLWWGIIGSLSEARGTIERRPVHPSALDAWFPREANIYLNGRILFSSLHRSITNEWSRFEPVEANDQ